MFAVQVLFVLCTLLICADQFHINSVVTNGKVSRHCMVLRYSQQFNDLFQQSFRGDLEMRERKCDISGTRKNSKAMSVSKSNVHTHRTQHVNLQTCRLWWPEGNKFVRVRISTRTLKTIKKNGLHKTAQKYGVNLNKFSLSSGTAPPKIKVDSELSSIDTIDFNDVGSTLI